MNSQLLCQVCFCMPCRCNQPAVSMPIFSLPNPGAQWNPPAHIPSQRELIATAALQGLLSNTNNGGFSTAPAYALELADKMIALLNAKPEVQA